MSIEIDWLMLADYATVVGNKLYVQGGGWDVLTVNSGFPVQQMCGITVSFAVPWDATNRRHTAEIRVEDADGKEVAKIGGQFEVGRPAGLPAGLTQRTQIAANLPLQFSEAGTYVLVGIVNGEVLRRVQFNVVKGPALQDKERQQRQQRGQSGQGAPSES